MDKPIKDIIVACKCGWQGPQRELVTSKLNNDRYCPVCARLFEAVKMPTYRDDQRSSKEILADGWPDRS